MKRNGFTPASREQRIKALSEGTCRACGSWTVDPAHVVSRAKGGCEHQDCTIPLCRLHHRSYDDGILDVLPLLTLDEQAHAVSHLGIMGALRCTTNQRQAA